MVVLSFTLLGMMRMRGVKDMGVPRWLIAVLALFAVAIVGAGGLGMVALQDMRDDTEQLIAINNDLVKDAVLIRSDLDDTKSEFTSMIEELQALLAAQGITAQESSSTLSDGSSLALAIGMSPEEVRTLLAKVSHTSADLPAGWKLSEEGKFESNEETAGNSIAGDEILDKYNEWGRVMGYLVSYERGETVFLSTVELYPSHDIAEEAFNWLPKGYVSQEQYLAAEFTHAMGLASGLDPSLFTVDAAQVPFAIVGDPSIAVRLNITLPNGQILGKVYLACLVEGRLFGCSSLVVPASVEENTALQELTPLARLMQTKFISEES